MLSEGQSQSADDNDGHWEVLERVLEQADVDVVTRADKHISVLVHVDRQAVALEQRGWDRAVELKVQRVHDLQLHLEDLVLREGILGDLHEISDHGRVELVNLAGDEHSCYAQQLELQDLDRLDLQEAINYAQGSLEGLWGQLELNLDN